MDALTVEGGATARAEAVVGADVGIEGLTCASCACRDERALKPCRAPSLATERARVTAARGAVTFQRLVAVGQGTGNEAGPVALASESTVETDAAADRSRRALCVS